MPTRAQVNSLSAMAAKRMSKAYPEAAKLYIRTLVSEAKLIGNPATHMAMQALLRELYTDIFGVDPVGKRHFYKWIQSTLTPNPGDQFRPADPIDNVSLDDAFQAEDENIT